MATVATMVQFPSVEGRTSRNGKARTNGYSSKTKETRSQRVEEQTYAGINISDLCRAMRRSRRVLKFFRDERRRAVIQYVGRHWGEGGAGRIVPVNLLARYIQVVSRNLISKNPRAMLSTMRQEMKPAVDAMQSWINQKFVDDYFHETLARFVVDAMVSIGIMKVALASPLDSSLEGYNSQVGEPYAEVIDLDDWVCDVGATNYKGMRFCGHRYTVPYEDAVQMGYFDEEERKNLAPDSYSSYNDEGDEKISTLGRGFQADGSEDYKEMVTLWEIYLPGEKKIVTMAGDSQGIPQDGRKPLRVQDWFGPKCGPYHFLGFGLVPGNLMPKAPVMDLIDFHNLINRLWRKTGDQAERQKTNLLLSTTQVDDGGRVTNASDGEPIVCDDPNSAKEQSYGGPSPSVVAYLGTTMEVFNRMAGNLDLLAGGGPQSKTATQDTMLNQNAAAAVADMQETTVASVARVISAMLEFWWYHPTQVMTSTKSLPGLPDMDLKRNLHPAFSGQKFERRGKFSDLQVRIDPYSMAYRSPQQRLQQLMGIVEKHIPVFQLLQQSGIMFDWQEYFKLIATYMDEPDIIRLFTVQEPMPVNGGNSGSGQQSPQSNEPREYIRRSVGADTNANRQSEADNMFAALAAQQENQSG